MRKEWKIFPNKLPSISPKEGAIKYIPISEAVKLYRAEKFIGILMF